MVISPVDFTVETVDGPDEKRLVLALCSMMSGIIYIRQATVSNPIDYVNI